MSSKGLDNSTRMGRSELGLRAVPEAHIVSMRHPVTLVSPEFFNRDAVIVAQELLGKIISTNGCSGIIVETEAYKTDKASHAHTRTPRSETMYSTYAHWYIYFIYGMYHCMNITTNGTNEAGAVLIRALQPLSGIEQMKIRRKTNEVRNLCSGPGKICTALNVTRQLNGTKINDKMHILNKESTPKSHILKSPRIGITNGKELEWRFYIKDNEFVSKRQQ